MSRRNTVAAPSASSRTLAVSLSDTTIMKVQTFLVIVFLIFTFNSCSITGNDIDRYRSQFEKQKNNFETLINLLKTQDLKIGFSVNENDLPDNIKKILSDLDISNINVNNTSCNGLVDYEFTSSWSSKATLYFSKDFCNKEQTTKGYHAKTSEMIEVWGMGNDWIMWIDYDFI